MAKKRSFMRRTLDFILRRGNRLPHPPRTALYRKLRIDPLESRTLLNATVEYSPTALFQAWTTDTYTLIGTC